jgi:hypothetical protein
MQRACDLIWRFLLQELRVPLRRRGRLGVVGALEKSDQDAARLPQAQTPQQHEGRIGANVSHGPQISRGNYSAKFI